MKDNAPSLTERLADTLIRAQSTGIPAPVIEVSRIYVLDWLGSALAGTATPPGDILLEYAASQAGQGAAVIGLAEQRNADTAALINGSLSHIVEMDDVHRASVLHPGATVIPAALAVAQREQRSGLDFLAAVILGYEVAIRIGEAVGRSHYYYWHNTSTCGVFGAAAAAGWLLGLSREQMVWALGNAGTQASGLWEFNADGAMTKHLHPGRAAANGVLAADLARMGFTGARRILEGERGFFAATSKDATPEIVTKGLTPDLVGFKIGGVSIKPHSSCRHTHSAIDAALAIRATDAPSAKDIESVRIELYQAALGLTDNRNPTSASAAKFSVQYCVSVALSRGHVSLPDFTSEAFEDRRVRELAAKTIAEFSPEIEARYPGEWPARVTVSLAGGRVLSEEVKHPRGDPENPLSQAELEAKFRQLLLGTPYQDQTSAFIKRVQQLELAEHVGGLLAAQGSR